MAYEVITEKPLEEKPKIPFADHAQRFVFRGRNRAILRAMAYLEDTAFRTVARRIFAHLAQSQR